MATDMIRALRLLRFGGPDGVEIDHVARPEAIDDEVVVRVVAASLNPVDYKIRDGQYPPVTSEMLPLVMGRDLAGTVETCGVAASGLKVGDPVFAMLHPDRGAFAERVTVRATEMTGVPAGLDLATAAAVPLAALTAWQGLFDHGRLSAGQTVLIHGAAGGVGHFAVQFARHAGARVIATAGPDDVDFVAELGADTVVDYRNEDFEDEAKDVDLVYDLIGGETQARSWAVIRSGGILVSTVGPPAGAPADRRGVGYHAAPNPAQLGQIGALIAAGDITVHIAARFAFDDYAAAFAQLEHGHGRGKIILTF